jgi:hypothetical protein
MKEKWHTGAFCDPHMQVNTSYTIRSLQKNGRSHHRNDHHYCAHDEPVSPDSPCPRRLDIPAVAYRVRLSVLSTGVLFPVGFHHVQPWSSPMP